MIRLIQEFGAHTGRSVSFDTPRVRIGRAPSCDLAFDPNLDLDASGSHCEIVLEEGGYFVVDLGSRNGTLVNNVRISRLRVRHGDVIECGNGGPRLRVEIPAEATPSFAPIAPSALPPGADFAMQPSSFGNARLSAPASTVPVDGPPGSLVPNAIAPPLVPASLVPDPNDPLYHHTSNRGGTQAVPSLAGIPAGAIAPSLAAPQPMSRVPPGVSVGESVAMNIPEGAHVGKRTLAVMIDQAIGQAGVRPPSRGQRVLTAFIAVVVLAALAGGSYLLWSLKESNDERLRQLNANGGGGERITQQYEAAIYLLTATRPGENARGFCTGFAVTEDLIATNAHCIDMAQDTIARGGEIHALRSDARGAHVNVVPVYRDPRYRNPSYGLDGQGFDVGLVRVTAGAPLPVVTRLASDTEAQNVRQGVQIYVYGFPSPATNEASPVATITTGILNRSTDFFDRGTDAAHAQKVQHTAQTTASSSGSPIFLGNGDVIAINAGSLADDERQSMTDPRTGQRVNVEVNRSSNFKFGMRADLIRAAVLAVGQVIP